MKSKLLGLIPALMISAATPAFAQEETPDISQMSERAIEQLTENCEAHSSASGKMPEVCIALADYLDEFDDDTGDSEDGEMRGKGNNNGKAKGHGKNAADNGKGQGGSSDDAEGGTDEVDG